MNGELYQVHVFTVRGMELTDARVRECVELLKTAGNFTEVGRSEHEFSPQGLTLVSLLSESHIAVHTWPEQQLAKIVVATCSDPAVPAQVLQTAIEQSFAGSVVTHNGATS